VKNRFLLPRSFRLTGLILAPVFCWLLGAEIELPVLERQTSVQNQGSLLSQPMANASMEVWMLGLVLSLIFIAFSRLRHEDEYTQHLRMTALLQSVYINYAVALMLILFVHGFAFLIYACMHALTLLLVFSVLFYSRMLFRASSTAA
jgi:FlaA1/EpsC-like NDP-sugar epimerase